MDTPKALLIILFILFAGLFACSKGEKSSAGKQSQHKEVQHAGKLRVEILPEVPTAAEDLQAVFSGGGSVTYHWEKNGQALEGEQGARLARKWFSRGDRITVIATANGEEGRASLTLENAPPQVMSVAISPENICRGVDMTATPAGSDDDADPVRYGFKWIVNGEAVPEDTPVLKGDKFKCGDRISLKVTPYDNQGAGKEYATQSFVIPKGRPYFVSTPPLTFKNNTYVYDAKAVDPDGDAITYQLASAPPGMSINNSTGRIEWRVPGQSRDYVIEIEAKGSTGVSGYQKYNLTVTAP